MTDFLKDADYLSNLDRQAERYHLEATAALQRSDWERVLKLLADARSYCMPSNFYLEHLQEFEQIERIANRRDA